MIANGLTALRLLLIAPVTAAFAAPALLPAWLLPLMILLAIVTDLLDGWVARRTGTASAAGQLFDHGTDFLFVTAGLAGAAHAGQVTPLLPVLIAVAFSQYVLDSRFLHRQKRLRMSFIGRLNGILYFVPLVLLALGRLDETGAAGAVLVEAGRWLAWLLVLSTLLSILDRAVAPLRR